MSSNAKDRSTLDDFVDLQRGNTYKSALLGMPGPVLLGLASIGRNGGFRSDKLRTYGGESDPRMLVRPGDIFVSLKDVTQSAELLGAVARVPSWLHLGRLTQDTVKLNFKPNCDLNHQYFIYWLLRTPQYRGYCRAHATGTTNLGLPREAFLSFPIPNLDPARLAVTNALQALEQKIDLLRQMNTTLEEIARTVFRAWFVDFEPVRAKAAGATSFRGMPQNLFNTLPDSFSPSEIGDIPTGWTVKPLSELVSQPVTRGLAPKYTKAGGVAVLNQKCVRNWEVNLDLGRRHDAEVKPLKDKSVERFDILVNSTGVGTLGRVAQVYHLNEETTVDSHLSLVKPNSQKIAPILLGINLTEREDEIERLGHGSTGQTELNRHKLGELGVLVPKEEFQSGFEDFALPLVERKTSNTHEVSVLSSMRDTLLPKLISGELKAPSLEALGLEGSE